MGNGVSTCCVEKRDDKTNLLASINYKKSNYTESIPPLRSSISSFNNIESFVGNMQNKQLIDEEVYL